MRLLEREADLQTLCEAVDDARRGSGRIVLVAGEAGIGKTTLIRELRVRERENAAFLTGACEPLSVPVPLAPVRELFEAAGGGDLLALGSEDRLVLARELLGALRAAAPTVAVIEDIHWADPVTLDLIRILGRRIDAYPIALLISYRDDEVAANPALGLLLGDLATLPALRRLRLTPLSESAVDELAGPHGLDARALLQATGGNPFLVVEAIAAGSRLPASVRDAALARVGRLSAAAREVVDTAAVVGQRVEPSLLEALIPASGAAAAEAITRGVLVEEGTAIGFRHELIREAIESSIPLPRRMQLHADVFRELCGRQGGAENARLAHHAELGGLDDQACRYAALAGADAERIGALRETRLQTERALRLGSSLSDRERFELLLTFSRAANFSNPRLEVAAQGASDAIALAQKLEDPVLEGRALTVSAAALWSMERVVEAREAARHAIATLEPTADVAALARAYAAMIRLEATAFDPLVALDSHLRALQLAESAGLEETAIDIAVSVGLALGHLGDRNALGVLLDARARARDAELAIQTVRSYVNLSVVGVTLRQHAFVDEVVHEGLVLLEEYNTPLPAMAIRGFRARSLLDRGRYAEARAVFADADENWHGELPMARAALALMAARIGERGAADALGRAWEDIHEIVAAESARHAMIRLARVEAAWLRGDGATAAQELMSARESASTARFARPAGELAVWSARLGVAYDQPPAGAPEPAKLELEGNWRGAITAWRELEAPYEAALAALPGDDQAARAALATLRQLGADAAARAFSREREARGARPARGPRASTLANAAGLTVREQEVLEQLATGATNAAIGQTLHLSERTVAHHVSAILRKLGAANRLTAIEKARALGLLGKDGQPLTPR